MSTHAHTQKLSCTFFCFIFSIDYLWIQKWNQSLFIVIIKDKRKKGRNTALRIVNFLDFIRKSRADIGSGFSQHETLISG